MFLAQIDLELLISAGDDHDLDGGRRTSCAMRALDGEWQP